MKSLRSKMTILIVLVVLVSSGLLSLISYERARRTMSSQLEESYSVAADKYAQELTAWLNTYATVIDTLSSQITLSRNTFVFYLIKSDLHWKAHTPPYPKSGAPFFPSPGRRR